MEPRPNRRKEKRVGAGGAVRLRLTEPVPANQAGVLLDVSVHGFRVMHTCRTLSSGQIVGFEHAFGSGRARVIWTRVLGDRVESGFLKLA